MKKKPTGSYEVGYCRPPKKNQFPKGQSGHPGGRHKGIRSFESIARDVAERLVTLSQNGVPIQMTMQAALVHGTYHRAIKGDTRACNKVETWLRPAVEPEVREIEVTMVFDDERQLGPWTTNDLWAVLGKSNDPT